MTILSADYVNSATVKLSDGKWLQLGVDRLTDTSRLWDFSELSLIGLNSQSQEGRIHTLTAIVYDSECIADSVTDFEAAQAERERLEAEQQAQATQADDSTVTDSADDSADSPWLYVGLAICAIVLIAILGFIAKLKKDKQNSKSQVVASKPVGDSVEVVTNREGPVTVNMSSRPLAA